MGIKLHGNFLWFLLFLPALIWGQCTDVPNSPATATIALQGSNDICSDELISFTSNINLNGGTNEVYQWQVQVGSGSWGDITGETSAQLTNYSGTQNNSKFRLRIAFCEGTAEEEFYYSNISPTITVNQVTNATASISSNLTEVCPGDAINFTATLTNQGSNPTFSWRVNNTEEGNDPSFSWDQFNDGDLVELWVTNYRVCAEDLDDNPGNNVVESNIIPIVVKAGPPAQPSTITIGDSLPFCPGDSKTYTVTNDTNASEYIWSFPSGWTGSSTTNSITITTGTTSGDISVAAKNDCGTSTPRILSVTAEPGIPNTPGPISGDTAVCPGIAKTYSITAVPNASQYFWTLPNGWNGGTTSITTSDPTLDITTGATGDNGNISVIASNNCGQSAERLLAVSVKPGTPGTPGAVTGAAAICPGLSATYTVSSVSGATEYIWTLPTGFSAPNLTTTNPSLTVTAGSSGSGDISVRAKNDCGTSANSPPVAISISNPAPTPSAISGPANVCANSSGPVLSPYTYSITAPNATNIAWSLPSGWSIISGAGTNTITVQTGASGGTVSVSASNSCGTNAQSIAVGLSNPAPVMPANVSITGPAKVCAGSTGIQYTIPAITNTTEYIWTVPTNWTITAGQNSRTITVTTPSTTSTNNTISVIAKNSCGNSAAKTYNVNSSNNVPGQPGVISTDLPSTAICPPVSGYKFWVTPVSGVTYNWILPSGFVITNGAGTNEITVNITGNTPFGNNIKVEVEAVNACGPSTKRTYNNISIDNFAYADLGTDQTVCSTTTTLNLNGTIGFGSNNSKLKIQSIISSSNGSVSWSPTNKTNNFTYTYTPSNQDLSNGQVTFTVTTESPTGNNNCAAQGTDQMTVFFKPIPSVAISSNSPICAGDTTTLTFTGTPNTKVTFGIQGQANLPPINIGASGTATFTTPALSTDTTYEVRAVEYTTGPVCQVNNITGVSTTINVTQIPTAVISYADPFCTSLTTPQGLQEFTGTNAYTGGTFSSSDPGLTLNETTGEILPETSTPGTYTVTYMIPESGGCPALPVTTQVSIQEKSVITSQPIGTRVCEGADVSFEVQATGESLIYQWYHDSVSSGNEVTGGTNPTLTLTSVTASQAGNYFVVIGNTASCEPVPSEAAELIVDQDILISSQPITTTVCSGDNTTLSVSATSGGIALDNTYSYQWFKGNAGAGTPISGANSPSLPLNNVTINDSGNYYVEISGPIDYTCPVATSDVAEFTVREIPTVQISGDTNICDGESTDIYFTNGIAGTVVTFTINNNNTNEQFITLDASGEAILNTGTLVATNNQDTAFTYELKSVAYADVPDCSNDVTGVATITVAPNPVVTLTFANDQTEFCTEDNNTHMPVLSGTGTFDGGTFSASGLNINPSDGSFEPSANNPGDYTIIYTIPAYGGCPEEIISRDISIYEEVKITSEPYNIGICSTEDAEFSVVASGDGLTYQWYKVVGNPDITSNPPETDDIALSGATSPNLSLPVATSSNAGEYYVSIAGTNACTPTLSSQVSSEVVSLNVDEDIVILEPATNVRVCEDSNQTVNFRFLVHAEGAPLEFTWIYENGTAVDIGGNSDYSATLVERDSVGFSHKIWEGVLTIANITSADQGSYAVRIDGSSNNFSCPIAVSNSFDLDVDPLPDPPAVQDVAYCIGDEATALTATAESGATLTWYLSEDDPAPTTTAPVPDTDTAGTISYFVTQKDAYCESGMAEIIVTVNALPAAPPITSTEANVKYCLGDTPNVLTATSSGAGFTLNWYGPNDPELPLTEAPTPPTANDGDIFYWVSQTDGNTCESPKEMITVSIYDLPDLTITNSGNDTICEGDEIILSVTDANDGNPSTTNYSWTWDDGGPLTGSSQPFNPTVTTTYTVTATNETGCVNTEEITITVDKAPIGGTITGPTSVCVTNPAGSLILEGFDGVIDRWEVMPLSTSTWSPINETNPDANYEFSGLSETTSYRAVVTSGVCEEVYSSEITITVDPVPVASGVLFRGTDRVFMMCEFPTEDYLVPLQYTGPLVGEIIAWQYRRNSQSGWTNIQENGENFTGNSLTGAQVNAAAMNESTLFRVEVQSGACEPNVFSDYATLSIIPSDIAPSPVQITPGEVCLGEIVTLSSSTGYGGSGTFQGGAFDNSAIANHGWRVMRFDDQTEYTFESAADNIRPDRWMRTNPHDYQMAHPSGNGSIIYERFDSCSCDDGNKGFAIVSGNNPSTLETPVFNLYTMDNPVLTFDQAYNLTYSDTIRVEISTDGGNTYNDILMEIGGPPNQGDPPVVSGNYALFGDDHLGPPNNMEIDLSPYAGLSNLRVRWLYDGTTGGIYTIDDIGLPEDPQNVQLIWYYDDDINDPNNNLEQIGEINQSTVTYPQDGAQWPKIGWNDFEVQTALVFDTNGDPCESAENSAVASVYVFDNYTSTAISQVGACGETDVQLSATITGVFQGDITEFPEGEGSTVAWEVIEAPAGYNFSEDHFVNTDDNLAAINDPQAIFQPTVEGNYTLRFAITPNESQTTRDIQGTMVTQDISANPCPMTHINTNFTFVDCTTLDFDGIDDHIVIADSYSTARTIETWVRPESLNGPGNGKVATIFSTENYELYLNASAKPVLKYFGKTLTSNKSLDLDGRWHHIAVRFNSGSATMYIDGIEITDKTTGTGSATGTGNEFIIGARYNGNGVDPDNYFSGWIEELRIWNTDLTEKQIRFMMNQRLKLDATGTVVSPLQGEVVPNLVLGDGFSSYHFSGSNNLDQDDDAFYNLTTNELLGYYRLISENPDPANLITFDAVLQPAGGNTPDHATVKADGRLYNITTDQQNTSPTPYFSAANGNWESDATWARPAVWDPPNSVGIDNTTPIDWNIARINHNISSGDKHITMLGLLSETPAMELSIIPDHFIRISHYLLLHGNMDLEGESQLLQDHGSILDNSSSGWAEIDQQGRKSSFNYNYWTSPFSTRGANNNSGFMLNQVLLDGSNPNAPQGINWVNGYFSADGAKTNPITISNEWIWDFRGGDADIYGDWLHLGSDYTEIVGAGFSMKGTTGSAGLNDKQNYVFRGKPNNGNIPTAELYLQNNQNYLVGNPYPSAIDAEKFLRDNLVNVGTGTGNNENNQNVFNGTLYYWDHFAGFTHILEEYIGGYATYTLSGSAPAISNDWRVNSGGGANNIVPEQYIPVAQGFFLNSAPVGTQNFAGDIIFKNTQRVFQPKQPGASIFLQQEEDLVKGSTQTSQNSDTRMKIRVKFESPKGYYRQILVTRDENTSNGFDVGYDAPLIENNVEDMYWWFENNRFVIQGVPSFENEQVLPLAIKTNAGGEFKIKIDKTENWPSGKELYLKDKLNDTIHDILKEPYLGKTEINGEIMDRFEIVFFREQAQDPADDDPVIPDPDDVLNPDLPIIDGLVGISYSTFSKQVKISNFDLLKVDKVMIFDMGGKLIQEFDELPTEEEILLGMRPVRSGVYIVKVFCETGICNKKIIVK